jgi:hypothetical protein
VKAARPVGFSVNWLNSIIHTSEEARKYLEDSSNRIQAKYRLLAEASVNEHLKAIFADELGLSQEERGKLAVSRSAAIQPGLSPTVVRAAGLLDEPRAQPPPPPRAWTSWPRSGNRWWRSSCSRQRTRPRRREFSWRRRSPRRVARRGLLPSPGAQSYRGGAAHYLQIDMWIA